MRRHSLLTTIYGCLILLSLCLLNGCNEPEFYSQRLDQEIVVDGQLNDWRNYTYYHEDETKAAISMVNDEHSLYLRFSTNDVKLQQQILLAGLTIWIDPKGGKGKTFGVHFPLGVRNSAQTKNSSMGNIIERQYSELDDEKRMELELLGPGKDESYASSRATVKGVGIEVKWERDSPGPLVYELKIPLVRTQQHPFAVDSPPGGTIGVGFMTGSMKRGFLSGSTSSEQQTSSSGRSGGRGGGGRGGGGRGGGGGKSSGGQSEQPDPMELWAKIHLSEEPSGPNDG